MNAHRVGYETYEWITEVIFRKKNVDFYSMALPTDQSAAAFIKELNII